MINFNRLFYIGILLFSVAFLFIGNRIASQNMFEPEFEPMPVYSAVVIEITERDEEQLDFGWGYYVTSLRIFFDAQITSGELLDEIVHAEFHEISMMELPLKEVEEGDKVLLIYHEHIGTFFFMDYVRINYIWILGGIFFVLIVIFGRKKGFNSIIALGFVCMAIFVVFIPAILSGMNIYIMAAIICAYSIVATLLIVIGPNKKATSAMLGCLGGVVFAGILMMSMDSIMHLTGLVDSEARSLLNIPLENSINIRAIIFAGVIIGSTGAIMDVAMSISSSLWELRQADIASDFRSLFRSGIEIGKDILGTMLNTLILAYIGSSLSVILLLTANATSFVDLFNREMIIVEFLRALVGSFGMFLTIPLTAAICGWLYMRNEHKERYTH
ncbi:MAG: YibE/F family protein [Defluviitaleaceae bacterium]|nr:YibE/F family protein [Defluviitaleaceae bacterium]